MCARVMPIMSSLPLGDRMARGGHIGNAGGVERRQSHLGADAAGEIEMRCGRMPCTGITSVIAGSVWIWPRMTLRKSTWPDALNMWPMATPSSSSIPPFAVSSAV
jgi:hypothetical protein